MKKLSKCSNSKKSVKVVISHLPSGRISTRSAPLWRRREKIRVTTQNVIRQQAEADRQSRITILTFFTFIAVWYKRGRCSSLLLSSQICRERKCPTTPHPVTRHINFASWALQCWGRALPSPRVDFVQVASCAKVNLRYSIFSRDSSIQSYELGYAHWGTQAEFYLQVLIVFKYLPVPKQTCVKKKLLFPQRFTICLIVQRSLWPGQHCDTVCRLVQQMKGVVSCAVLRGGGREEDGEWQYRAHGCIVTADRFARGLHPVMTTWWHWWHCTGDLTCGGEG